MDQNKWIWGWGAAETGHFCTFNLGLYIVVIFILFYFWCFYFSSQSSNVVFVLFQINVWFLYLFFIKNKIKKYIFFNFYFFFSICIWKCRYIYLEVGALKKKWEQKFESTLHFAQRIRPSTRHPHLSCHIFYFFDSIWLDFLFFIHLYQHDHTSHSSLFYLHGCAGPEA